MKSKEIIEQEISDVYDTIIDITTVKKQNYCHSWWINNQSQWNNKENKVYNLTTSTIVRRAKHLVKRGLLIIDKSRTSTSTGTCYILVEKECE